MNRGERARSDILDAAERLIAERGVQVPLRDIALTAGHRNNSAVNYHFRSRDELIDAVVRRRLEPMERIRAEMVAALDADEGADLLAWLRIMVVPLAETGSAHYARFLRATSLHLREHVRDAHGAVWATVLNQLAAAIPAGDRGMRGRRVQAVATTMFALLAERENDVEAGADVGSTEEIVALLAAMLTAPMPAMQRVDPG